MLPASWFSSLPSRELLGEHPLPCDTSSQAKATGGRVPDPAMPPGHREQVLPKMHGTVFLLFLLFLFKI